MPSKLFGQYKEEQVPQINYLPYTAKMSEMLVQGAGNLASGIAEGIEKYKANEDLSEFNKTQTKTIAPILENLRADASKSKELESYVPEIDAQIKALSESNGKSPKVAASVIAGVGAYLKGFNDRFNTQQKMRDVAVAGDIASNYTSSVDTVEPAEIGADAVDYNPDLSHWQNISAFDKYLTSAEEQAKGKGVTVDRKLATINWLKSKKNFIENNEIPNLSPEKRQRLLEVLSNEIDNMDAGEYADGEVYNPEISPDAKFTINDVNGNPVNVSLPAKGEPVSTATGVSSATLSPSSQPQGTPVSPSVAPQKVSTSEIATSAPVISSSQVQPAQPASTGTQGISWIEKGHNLTPEESRKIMQEYFVNLSKWNNPEIQKGFDSFSDYVVRIKQIANERANQIVFNSPSGYERFDPYNPEKELKEVEGEEVVEPVILNVPDAEGNWENVDLTAPDKKKEPIIDYIENASGQGEKSSKAVNPMSGGGKMAMIGANIAPAKVDAKKVDAISTKNLTPEARDAHYVKKANESMVQNQWSVVGATNRATKWADRIQADIDQNGFEATSIDFNAYGAWAMKNPNKADILSAGGTVASVFVPVGRAMKIASNIANFETKYGATAWNSPAGKGILKSAKKIFEDGKGKVTQAEALAQAQNAFKTVKEAAKSALQGGWNAEKYNKYVNTISTVAGGTFVSLFAADNDFAMPDFDNVLSGENSQPELKQKTEKLIDEIRELRGGGFKFGLEAMGIVDGWDDKTDAEKYTINLKISDKIAKYKKDVETIGETSKTRARALQANPLSKQDIIDNKKLSTQTATEVANVNTRDTRVGAIKTEGRINVGEREYKKQLDIQEKKDNLKKFMVQKYGYVPSGFDAMYKTMHPEDEFNTMEVNGVGYFHNGKVWSPVPVEKGESKSMKQRAEDSAFVFGHQDARGNLIPQEFEIDSGVRLRGLFRGTQKQLEEFTTNYGNLLSSKKVVNRLIAINDMVGESMIWNADLKGEAMGKISELKSNYRNEIIGVGTVSNYEQELINDVISNPTTFFSLESSDRAKLLAILQRTEDRLKRLPSRYNLEVSFTENKEDREKNLRGLYNSSSKKSSKQLEWEKNHPELSSLDVKGVKRSITLPEESK